MDHTFKQDYILIRKARTVDGANMEIDDDDRGVFKEIEAPITALKDFELLNEKLPKAQKMKIRVVRMNEQITKPVAKPKAPEAEVVSEEKEVEQPAPLKRGPKPKTHDLE